MKTKKNFRGLSGLDLKCLAMVLMVLDHLHYFFEFTGRIPLFFSQLGRLSGWQWRKPRKFWICAFCIRNLKK